MYAARHLCGRAKDLQEKTTNETFTALRSTSLADACHVFF